jgi:sulfate permease, SulP family
LALPDVPLNLETLKIILPYSLTLAMVGLLESLMTAAIVDEMMDTDSSKNRECTGQGLANIVAGLFGGMAGCAMIGQSVINVSSGGRGRLSTLWAGAFLLFLILVLDEWVRQIPMAALVAVMIMVSINTFQWGSILAMRLHPKSSSIVMLATVAVVVLTHDLAKGVLVGVILSGIFFARKVAKFFSVTSTREGDVRTYRVDGEIFFATAEAFHSAFDFREEDLKRVVIDVGSSHFWDITGINALDRVVLKFRHHDIPVEIVGLNEASASLVEKLGTHNKEGVGLASGH